MSYAMELLGMRECDSCGDPYTVMSDDIGKCRSCVDAPIAAKRRLARDMQVAEATAKWCADLVRNLRAPEGEDGYNLEEIAQGIVDSDLSVIIKGIK